MTDHQCSGCLGPAPDRPLEGEEETLVDQLISTMLRPDAIVEEVVPGPKFIAVKADGRVGLSSLLGAGPKPGEMETAMGCVGKSVKDGARYMRESSPFLISLGAGCLNAAYCPDPDRVNPLNYPADSLIETLGKDRKVGLVGEFPFVKDLKEKVGELFLFELKPVLGGLPQNRWEEVLSDLDVLALTGTTLLTRKMAWFLSRAAQAKIIIIGPSTPFAPVLFKRGADYLSGSVVTDFEKVRAGIEAGLPFKKVKKNGGVVFTQWDNPLGSV